MGVFPGITFIDQSDWFWPLTSKGYSQFDAAVSPVIAGGPMATYMEIDFTLMGF